jgi:hypothetical protein
MRDNNFHTTLTGKIISLEELDAEERKLVALLRKRAGEKPNWNDFDNFWMARVGKFYDDRGMPRKKSVQAAPVRIAQDLSARIAVATGMARPPDYLDELAELIRTRFKTRRAFCKAAALPEELLDRVLSGRKDISLETLSEALQRIGCTLHIAPLPGQKRTG